MNYVKKALNFVLLTVILTIGVIALALAAGFVDKSNQNVIDGLMVTASIISLIASIVLLVACLFGKMGKNKHFSLAFLINILMILVDIVIIILNVAKVQIQGLTVGINIADSIVAALTYFLVIMAIKEAVPSLKGRALLCALFIIAGFALMGAFECLPNVNQQAAGALGFFGGLFFLTGCIMFVVLIVKAVHRFAKKS